MNKMSLKFIGTILFFILGFSSYANAQEVIEETVSGGVYRAWELKAGMKIALRGAKANINYQWLSVTGEKYKTSTFNTDCIFEIVESKNPGKYLLKNNEQYIAKAGTDGSNISFVTDTASAEKFTFSLPGSTSDNPEYPNDGFKYAYNMVVRFTASSNTALYLNTGDINNKPKFSSGTGSYSVWLVYSVGDHSNSYQAKKSALSNLDFLVDNTNVIFRDVNSSASRQGWLYERDDHMISTTQYEPTKSLNSSRYIWTVNKVDGGYTFTNLATGRWMRFDNSKNQIRANNSNVVTKNEGDKGVFTIAQGSTEQYWQISSNGQFFNGDDRNGVETEGFNTWDGAHDYEIYPVIMQDVEKIHTVTVEYIFKNGYKLKEGYTTLIEDGGQFVFSAPTIANNTIQYYQVGDIQVETSEKSYTINDDITIKYVYDFTKFPFESSDIDNSFPENTKWYLLTLNNAYLQYEKGQNYIPLVSNYNYEDKYWWAFKVKENGSIEIYNKAAGPEKILSSASPASNELTYPIMINKGEIPEGNNSAWDITSSLSIENKNGFFLDREGNEAYKLNYRTEKLAYWNSGANTGSTFLVTSVSDEINAITASETVKEPNAIGVLTPETYARFIEILEKGTIDALKEAKAISESSEPTYRNQFDSKQYYRIENIARRTGDNNNHLYEGGYLEVVDHLEHADYNAIYDFYSNVRSNNRATALWKFAETDIEGQYKLLNLNAKKYIKGNDGSYLENGTEDVNDADILTLVSLGSAQFNIKKAGESAQRLHVSGIGNFTGALMYHNDGEKDSPSAWYIIPATTIDITISEVGYATVNYPFAVQLPKEIKAYTGQIDSENKAVFILTEVENGLIPANTPVVLQGAPGAVKTYTLTINPEDNSEKIAQNELEGTFLSQNFDIESTIYGLGKDNNNEVGFYKMSEEEGANRTVGANKAYLPGTQALQGVKGITFSFDDNSGETTGIENTTINWKTEEFYDLQGRRVMNPTKGIYVTKSGKKVLFTK